MGGYITTQIKDFRAASTKISGKLPRRTCTDSMRSYTWRSCQMIRSDNRIPPSHIRSITLARSNWLRAVYEQASLGLSTPRLAACMEQATEADSKLRNPNPILKPLTQAARFWSREMFQSSPLTISLRLFCGMQQPMAHRLECVLMWCSTILPGLPGRRSKYE